MAPTYLSKFLLLTHTVLTTAYFFLVVPSLSLFPGITFSLVLLPPCPIFFHSYLPQGPTCPTGLSVLHPTCPVFICSYLSHGPTFPTLSVLTSTCPTHFLVLPVPQPIPVLTSFVPTLLTDPPSLSHLCLALPCLPFPPSSQSYLSHLLSVRCSSCPRFILS